MKKWSIITLLLMFCFTTLCSADMATPAVEAVGPKAQVEQTVNAILDILRCDEAEEAAQRQHISTLIRNKFNFTVMSRGALGRNWQVVSAEERQQFVELFSRLLEETYLGRIRAYTDQKVSYGDETIRKGRAVVETFIHNGGVEIPITYKLIPQGQEWRVYDVVIEEVSLIRNYRSSYKNILRSKGMAHLLDQMSIKIESLQKRGGHLEERKPNEGTV
ncbi:MAG: ABC transporter substrate-binding protein [Deltaproteobacteria bacterium]|nr:ABC transporter substrate-binding protein [Deltaproteobacteria bacterium]